MKIALFGLVIVIALLAQTVGLQPHTTLMPKSDGSSTNELRFRELAGNGQNYVGFKAPTNLPTNNVYTWPTTSPAGLLSHDGSGNLSWSGAAPPPGDSVGSGQIIDGSILPIDLSPILRQRQVSWIIVDINTDIPDTFDMSRIFSNRVGAVHLTEVQCESNNGVATINLLKDDGTPANVLSSNATCNGTPVSSFVAGEDALTLGQYLGHVTVSAGANLRRMLVTIKYSID